MSVCVKIFFYRCCTKIILTHSACVLSTLKWWFQCMLPAKDNYNPVYCYCRMSSDNGFEPKYVWCLLQGRNPSTAWIFSPQISCWTETENTASMLCMRSIRANLLTDSQIRYPSGKPFYHLNHLLLLWSKWQVLTVDQMICQNKWLYLEMHLSLGFEA